MPPLTVMVKPVSAACNMRCGYCFYTDVAQHRSRPSMGAMDDETLQALVRRALQYAEGQLNLVFQGGEPTLAGVTFYQKLIAYEAMYNTRGIPIHHAIQTNGYCLDDALLELFYKERFLVGVSLDGPDELHDRMRLAPDGTGSAAQVKKTIERLKARGIPVNILCVVNGAVADQPAETFHALRRYRHLQYIACLDPLDGTVQSHSLSPAQYGKFLCESFDLYFRFWRKGTFVSIRNFDNYVGILMGRAPENCAMSCRCAQYYLVEGDGGVYPCDFYVLDDRRMGNIKTDSFFRLEKSPVAARFVQESLVHAPECGQCRWFSLCRGGCRRDREPFFEEHPNKSRWCESFQMFFEYAYPRICEMAQKMGGAGR